jgi:hypothetical protein
MQLSKSRLAVGDFAGQLVVFDLVNDNLVFNSETTAFDLTFDPTKAYEVPRRITAIEWLDDSSILTSNDQEIKFFRLSR